MGEHKTTAHAKTKFGDENLRRMTYQSSSPSHYLSLTRPVYEILSLERGYSVVIWFEII